MNLYQTPYERFKAQRFFGSLNGLRFLAILAVMWNHTGAASFELSLGHHGFEGVTLFFGISGFLITTLLLRERERTGAIDMRGFYIRRTLRIFPLYYSMIALYVVLVYFTATPDRFTNFFINLPAFLTYTSNFFLSEYVGGTMFAFAWSLAAEEQFYMVWPWVEKKFSERGAVIIMITVLVLIIIIPLIALSPTTFFSLSPNSYLRMNVLNDSSIIGMISLHIMPAIGFGVLAAHALNNETVFNILYRTIGNRYSPIALILMTLGYLSISEYYYTVSHVLMTLIVISCVIREDHVLSKPLQMKLFVIGGTVSYGMYMMHMLTLNVVEKVLTKVGMDGPILIFVFTVIGTMIAAYISYTYYESYFLSLKSKYDKKRPTIGVTNNSNHSTLGYQK